MRLTIAIALALGSAACNQSDSGNVMAPTANALTPAQVDLALGPEPANDQAAAVNGGEDVGAVNSASAVEAADTEDALDETVPDETADQPAAANSDSEQ